MIEGPKIVGINLHVAQTITGQVRGHVNAEKAGVTLTQDPKGIGIWIKGKGTCKLVPYTNIQGIDVQEPGKEPIVLSAKS